MEDIPPDMEPAEQREYNVQMPRENVVYYDTILDQTATVHSVDQGEEFVTYVIENKVDNVHTEPIERFLAWLAAGRFVKLGDRLDPHGVDATDEEIAEVFVEAYGYDPRDMRPLELARFLLAERLDETLVIDDE